MTAEIVVSTFYDLRDAAAFDRAARLMLARLRLAGMEGVRSYRFLGTGLRDRRLVAICDSPADWVELHERISPWAESAALRAAGRLARMDVFGALSPPLRAWAETLGLGRRLRLIGDAAPLPGSEPIRRPEAGRSLFRRLAGG